LPHFSRFDAELKQVREVTRVKGQVDKLVEELEMINKQSFGMACSIHKEPALRTQSGEKARLLRKRLLDIVEEIEQIDPTVYKQWFHRISESLLDLDFVMAERGISSLRLGDIIKWGK
jgi:hypothetical protein